MDNVNLTSQNMDQDFCLYFLDPVHERTCKRKFHSFTDKPASGRYGVGERENTFLGAIFIDFSDLKLIL